ncbi:hypothetical protein AMATHDRAFT_67128 [Amanita thiersii Skay4041]|uniref:Zinc-finger domain-containing protein n=1 Tax=Amanita thiersii Skay4041 TaxID=703135 RepID=A0A2A9NAM6_9AGAR|nr:hypothetical protein AMATHDRAFT_67128 [Amanita thiersii Skay4041]
MRVLSYVSIPPMPSTSSRDEYRSLLPSIGEHSPTKWTSTLMKSTKQPKAQARTDKTVTTTPKRKKKQPISDTDDDVPLSRLHQDTAQVNGQHSGLKKKRSSLRSPDSQVGSKRKHKKVLSGVGDETVGSDMQKAKKSRVAKGTPGKQGEQTTSNSPIEKPKRGRKPGIKSKLKVLSHDGESGRPTKANQERPNGISTMKQSGKADSSPSKSGSSRTLGEVGSEPSMAASMSKPGAEPISANSETDSYMQCIPSKEKPDPNPSNLDDNEESSPIRMRTLPLFPYPTPVTEGGLEGGDAAVDDSGIPLSPSAKALGKRKAVSPQPSGPMFTVPTTPPRLSVHTVNGDELGRSDTDGVLHMEQFLNDLGTSPCLSLTQSSSQQQLVGNSPDNSQHIATFAISGIHGRVAANDYDLDSLSRRALMSIDNDPFLSGAGEMQMMNDADPLLPYQWAPMQYETGDLYNELLNDNVTTTNGVIDSFLLRGQDDHDMFSQAEQGILSLSHPISPRSNTHDALIEEPSCSHSLTRSPPARDDFQPSYSRSLSPSTRGRRRLVRPHHLEDMVNIADLDLSASSTSSDETGVGNVSEAGSESRRSPPTAIATTVTPASTLVNGQPRRGPRIVSAKELAKIQKQKALERQRKEALAKEALAKEDSPASLVSVPVKKGPPHKPRPSKYPLITEHTFCHQCRRRTFYLKMDCACGKSYCVRCLDLRYESGSFDFSAPNFLCPACEDKCSCDVCTKKRGEVYVSLRKHAPVPHSDRATELSLRPRRPKTVKKPSYFRLSSDEDEDFGDDEEEGDSMVLPKKPLKEKPRKTGTTIRIRVDVPFPPTPIFGAVGSYWGTVYSFSGEKIATAYVGEGNENVIVSCPLETLMVASGITPKKRRVFVGKWHDSWGYVSQKKRMRWLVPEEEKSENERSANGGERKKAGKPRRYVGIREMLFKRIVMPKPEDTKQVDKPKPPAAAPDAAGNKNADRSIHWSLSLSPLSSLSSLPDSEPEHGLDVIPAKADEVTGAETGGPLLDPLPLPCENTLELMEVEIRIEEGVRSPSLMLPEIGNDDKGDPVLDVNGKSVGGGGGGGDGGTQQVQLDSVDIVQDQDESDVRGMQNGVEDDEMQESIDGGDKIMVQVSVSVGSNSENSRPSLGNVGEEIEGDELKCQARKGDNSKEIGAELRTAGESDMNDTGDKQEQGDGSQGAQDGDCVDVGAATVGFSVAGGGGGPGHTRPLCDDDVLRAIVLGLSACGVSINS